MIPMSTKEPVRWTPPWREGEDGAPVFLLRAGSVMDRMNLEAELAGEHGAGEVHYFQLVAAFEAGLDAILGEASEDAQNLKALVAAEKDLEPGSSLPPADAAALASAREAVNETWPDFRALVARNDRRKVVLPVLAFRRFCVGWEGEGMPAFKRGLGGRVDDDVLAEIKDTYSIVAAGTHAYMMLYVRGQEKNSPPPSTSGGTPKDTTSCIPPAAGSSMARRGRKTPA